MARSVVSISLTILLLAVAAAGAAAEQRPFTVHDLVAMERIADPQPSPDGVQRRLRGHDHGPRRQPGRSDLWLAAVDGSRARRLTTHEADDWAPRWAGDRHPLLPVSALRLRPGLAARHQRAARRSSSPACRSTSRPRGRTGWHRALRGPDRVPRLRRPGPVHRPAAGAGEGAARRAAGSTTACSSATGTAGRTAAATTSSGIPLGSGGSPPARRWST